MKDINYSISDEKNYTTNQIKKIEQEFGNIQGLSDILEHTKNLFGCEIYLKIFKEAKNTAEKDYERLNISVDKNSSNNESLSNKYPQLTYASVLSKPLIYLPSLHGDLIIYTMFISTFTLLSTICNVKSSHLVRVERIFNLMDKVMVLFDEFNQDLDYTPPTQNFYDKLKTIKWDKKSKKLFSKIQNIRNNITNVNSKNMDMYNTRFNLTENYLLIFLAASSAVKREDLNITMEDVVRSHKTYYKLINMDLKDFL